MNKEYLTREISNIKMFIKTLENSKARIYELVELGNVDGNEKADLFIIDSMVDGFKSGIVELTKLLNE